MEGHEGPPSSEGQQTPERVRKVEMTPVVAHMALGTLNTKYFNPDKKDVDPGDTEKLKKAQPDQIKYQAVNALSFESRLERYRNDGRKFDEINLDWNGKFWTWIRDHTDESS